MKFVFALILAAQAAWSKPTHFVVERGAFRYDLTDVQAQKSTRPYLIFQAQRTPENAQYKITRKGEYQIRSWFLRDWEALQDLFTLDEEKYVAHFGGESFAEAKRRAFAQLPFDHNHFIHRHDVPTMREWGRLNHPPIRALKRPLTFYSERFSPRPEARHSPYFSARLQREIDQTSRSELSFGNRLKALEDRDAYAAKLALIAGAKTRILMSSLVFVCDASTQHLVDQLIQRHREGVQVHVLVDYTISKYLKHRACLQQLRSAGVEVIEGNDFWKYQGRTIYHTKSLVVDETKAIAGGHNMIDADNISTGTNFMNRDVDLAVEGPMVTDMARAFIADWQHFRRARHSDLSALDAELKTRLEAERASGVRGEKIYDEKLGDATLRLSGVCRYIRQSPFEDGHTIGRAYLALLGKVQTSLSFTNAIMADTKVTRLSRLTLPIIEVADSFVMYNQLWTALQDIAKRGIPVDILTTNIDMAGNENVAILNEVIRERMENEEYLRANFDLFKLHLSNRFYGKPHYRNLLKDWMPFENVHVWKHMSFQHSKIMYFDRLVASVGSYNIQHNATDHSYEATAICQDRELNAQLEEILVEDIVNSIPLVFRN